MSEMASQTSLLPFPEHLFSAEHMAIFLKIMLSSFPWSWYGHLTKPLSWSIRGCLCGSFWEASLKGSGS